MRWLNLQVDWYEYVEVSVGLVVAECEVCMSDDSDGVLLSRFVSHSHVVVYPSSHGYLRSGA